MNVHPPPSRRRARRRRRAVLTAGAAALAVAAVAPAVANAAWADPQTICANCSESDGLVSFAEAPNGAAVAAWHGNKSTVASYRGPNDDTFGPPFTIATGGKPQFVRAAIGADGTAAVSTWLPDAANSQVVGRITPAQKTWTLVPAPAGGTNAHIAVGPDGSVTATELIVTSPTDQKLNVYTLPPGATAFSAPKTLYSLAAPYNGFQGFTIVGNGAGAYVAGWTLQTGVSSQTQAFASYSSNGTTWTAPEQVGTAPSALGAVAVDGVGQRPGDVHRRGAAAVGLPLLPRRRVALAHARPGRRRERHRLRPARQRRAGRHVRHQRRVGVHGPERRQRRLQPLAGARDERERRRGRVARG